MSQDRLVYRGKSKDVYEIVSGTHAGKYRLLFTDRATGYFDANGRAVFDPGRDVVVGEIPGKGAIACRFASHFFKLLQQYGIPSHYIDTLSDNEMVVEPAIPLSMQPDMPELPGAAPLENLEFTWRNNATGSFWRRYPFVKPGKNLNCLVEIWTKGEHDTLITTEALAATGALSREEIDAAVALVKEIAALVSAEFTAKGLHVLDGKFELGRLSGGYGSIVIIDEISPDVLRVCRDYRADSAGDWADVEAVTTTTLKDGKRSISHSTQMSASELIEVFK